MLVDFLYLDMRLTIILLISIIIPSDYITGIVFDQDNNPISGVNIHVIESDFFTSSDENGNFIINYENKKLTIKFSHIKYNNKIINFIPDSNKALRINLIEKSIDLEQTVVTGLRAQTYIKDTPVLTHVITSEDIEKSAYTSVKEVLEMSLPNVQNVMSSHAGISNEQVKVQGLDNKYLLFLVDGNRISGEFAGNLDFKMLDLSNVDRIEIVEGGMSSLYGSSAIGGVVNIITKKNKKPFNIQYSYLHDEPMVKAHFLNGGFNYKNFFYNINFVNQYTDGYDLTPSDSNIPFPIKTLEEYETISIKHVLGYDNKRNFIFSINYKDYENHIYLYENKLFQNDTPDYYTILKSWVPRFEDINYGFNLKFYKNKSLFNAVYNFEEYTKSNYYFNYFEENCSLVDCNDSNNLTSAEFINAIDKRESFLIQYNLEYKSDNLFTLGVEFNNDSYSSFNIYNYQGDYDNNGQCDVGINDCLVESIFDSQNATKKFNKKAFFIGNQWSFKNDNKLGASFRLIDSENFEDNYVSSLSYMIKHYQPYDIRFNYSKGFRTPAIKELYYNWYGHSPAIIGNPNLIPTTNNYISTSIEKRLSKYTFSIELFYNDVNDMIGINYTEDTDGNQVAEYNNYKNILFYGINSHLDLKYNKNTFKFVYNFTNPQSENSEALELISKHAFRLNWSRNFIKDKFDISFNSKFSGSKFIILDSKKTTLDAYIISDIIGIFNLNKYSEFKFGYKNIFNYKDERRFLEEGSDFLTTYDPGRRFILEIKFKFD